MERHARHRLRNTLQSAVLVAGMAAIAGACAWFVWGPGGVIWAFLGVALALLFSPGLPSGLALSLYRARAIHPAEFREGYAVLEELARRAALPGIPTLYYVPSTMLNAFAVGRRHDAAIAVTDGMLRSLTMRELAGVLAHEVSHVANNDIRIMNLADVISRVTSLLAFLGIFLVMVNLPLVLAGEASLPWLLVVLLVFAPTLMSLLQLALSRSREYDADVHAAELTRDPEGLASALLKLERFQGRFWESVFMPGRRNPEPSLLRTHPSTEERVRRLMELAGRHDRHASPFGHDGRLAGLPPGARPVRHPPRWRWSGLWY